VIRESDKKQPLENNISSNLHVLTLTPFFPSAGDEVSGCFISESLRHLALLGVTSSVIAVDPIYHRRRKPNPQSPAEWILYPQLPGNFGLSSAGRFLGSVLLNRVRKLHRRSPIHAIHAHAALPCGHAAAFLSERLNIPFVVTIHGLDVFNRCFQRGIAAAWRKKSSLHVYEKAARVICISEKVRDLLTQESNQKVSSEVVYNGTDPEFFAPASLDGASSFQASPTILVVGTLLAGKGQELVLRALARLKDRYPALQAEFIGDGAHRDRFIALAQELQVADRVHFLGRRTRSEVAEAMRRCTLFVLPSRFEGLGCVYLEAMASGKPAIGCRGQGIGEIIEDGVNGALTPVDGLDELAHKLQALLADSELRTRIGVAARQTILDRFTLSHQARNLFDIYRQVAQ
jgi:teichuronic acid biosynthesis glycosyltransferase TuaC